MTTSARLSVYALSMETIYADSLFALNLIIDYFLLLCSGKVAGAELKRGRFALAAALGAAYAVASILPGADFLCTAPMKLALGVIIGIVAFGGEDRLARCIVIFLAVSAAFGGAVWGASMLAGSSLSGSIYVPVSMRVLILSFAACYAAVSIVFKRVGKTVEREIIELQIEFRGKKASLRALRDTGNGLYDPVSGKSVAVADAAALLPLLPDGADALASSDPTETFRLLSELPGCRGKITLIPYSAVGTRSGMLAALRPDEVRVGGQSKSLLVAVYPARLSEDGTYSAVI